MAMAHVCVLYFVLLFCYSRAVSPPICVSIKAAALNCSVLWRWVVIDLGSRLSMLMVLGPLFLLCCTSIKTVAFSSVPRRWSVVNLDGSFGEESWTWQTSSSPDTGDTEVIVPVCVQQILVDAGTMLSSWLNRGHITGRITGRGYRSIIYTVVSTERWDKLWGNSSSKWSLRTLLQAPREIKPITPAKG